MNKQDIINAIEKISATMTENRDYLVSLDQRNGDGDLGISMANGFAAAVETIKSLPDEDLGMLLNKTANSFNEAAPSSLGTIVTFIFKGMAKSLKGKNNECSLSDLVEALKSGIANVTEKAGSTVGQKTILDSLVPAIECLEKNIDNENRWQLACDAAKQGSDNTANMKAVWGRAAYYGDDSIGIIDGGSVVGYLIFKSLV